MPRPKAHRLPPRDRTEPGICVPDTPFQLALIFVGCLVLFFAWMWAIPNAGG